MREVQRSPDPGETPSLTARLKPATTNTDQPLRHQEECPVDGHGSQQSQSPPLPEAHQRGRSAQKLAKTMLPLTLGGEMANMSVIGSVGTGELNNCPGEAGILSGRRKNRSTVQDLRLVVLVTESPPVSIQATGASGPGTTSCGRIGRAAAIARLSRA